MKIRGGGVPPGCILIWSGAADNIPDGWALCDGQNGTPDLREKFVLGAGILVAVGTTGGETSHTLTIDEMPSHAHTISAATHELGLDIVDSLYIADDGMQTKNFISKSTGSSSPHNNMPPYYALCYIMKTA